MYIKKIQACLPIFITHKIRMNIRLLAKSKNQNKLMVVCLLMSIDDMIIYYIIIMRLILHINGIFSFSFMSQKGLN